MTAQRPFITDHALLRYLERGIGIPVENYRKALEKLLAPAVAVGASRYSALDVTFALNGEKVTTVLPTASPSTAVIGSIRANGVKFIGGQTEDKTEQLKSARRRGTAYLKGRPI